jgi:hypothetical protein
MVGRPPARSGARVSLRVRTRRGHGKAIVATARKSAVLLWCMLTREQDYALQQPSLTARKLRRVEIAGGAPTRVGKPSAVWVTRERMRHAEKQLAAEAQASYERAVRDWPATGSRKKDAGASATAEHAYFKGALRAVARQARELLTPAL